MRFRQDERQCPDVHRRALADYRIALGLELRTRRTNAGYSFEKLSSLSNIPDIPYTSIPGLPAGCPVDQPRAPAATREQPPQRRPQGPLQHLADHGRHESSYVIFNADLESPTPSDERPERRNDVIDQVPAGINGNHEPEFVLVRICTCGKVSLREGDIGGDAVSLAPSEAKPLLESISAAFVPGTAEPSADVLDCLACVGSLVTGPRPAVQATREMFTLTWVAGSSRSRWPKSTGRWLPGCTSRAKSPAGVVAGCVFSSTARTQ
jgi:hypothetical protein